MAVTYSREIFSLGDDVKVVSMSYSLKIEQFLRLKDKNVS